MTRSVAFYLPQFHRIAENDEWWGEGFTEWDTVRGGMPRFAGHWQPHVPAELGYYDLAQPEVRIAQSALAAGHAIDAFCYYHYWFSGRRLLEAPFVDMLSSGEPDFPFMLCWANEPWTRTWSGRTGTVLMEQRYGADDDVAHIRSILPAFADARYVRVDGRPVFLVYKASQLPEPRRTTDSWRVEAARAGIGELYLARVESGPGERDDPSALGFDAAVDFQPDWRALRSPLVEIAARRIGHRLGMLPSPYRRHIRTPYASLVRNALDQPAPPYVRYPTVVPSWDNSARRTHGAVIVEGSTPEAYGDWVRVALRAEPELLFVNAWNEWGEGCHLEPDAKWGRAYLDAHATAVRETVVAS
jgi:lipopolysaccharide biosynthesis protein